MKLGFFCDVSFINLYVDAPLSNWWDNGLNQIAFARATKGFIVINNDDFPLITTLNVIKYYCKSYSLDLRIV